MSNVANLSPASGVQARRQTPCAAHYARAMHYDSSFRTEIIALLAFERPTKTEFLSQTNRALCEADLVRSVASGLAAHLVRPRCFLHTRRIRKKRFPKVQTCATEQSSMRRCEGETISTRSFKPKCADPWQSRSMINFLNNARQKAFQPCQQTTVQ